LYGLGTLNIAERVLDFGLVFGPSAEKRALAQNVLVRELPRCPVCPVCRGGNGFQVYGGSLDHFQCNSCQAKWDTEPLPNGVLGATTLAQPSGYDFRGIEIVGIRCQPLFFKNFDASYGDYLKKCRSDMAVKLGSVVSLEIGEELIWSWPGVSWIRVPAPIQPVLGQTSAYTTEQHSGQLFLTNERLIWVQDGIFNFEIPLEDLTSFVPASTYQGSSESCLVVKSRRNIEAWLKLWLWFGQKGNVEVARDNRAFAKVQSMIFGQQRKKRERIQREKQREHVQVVLDFSSIRDTLSKGGIVMSSFKCPQCGGALDLPETGKQTTCKYCGASIKPIDIFDKIKSIVS
jgi:hypothetical protein